ncbi:murein transglycosylase [Bacteroidia bacterium]|nr:murein transglycosylase [Bacteroidia bacterium]GHT27028.1 murein transglycosylase [Bacteroidia bacterium]
MKRYNYILLALSLGFVVLTGIFLLSGKEVQTPDSADFIEQNPDSRALTFSAPIPETVEFCGEIISLDRLDMRERFDREINAFTYLHSTTMLYIKRANRFFPIIEPILKRNNIPDDFKYLCVIESNLDIRALSPANAAGFWQFMESTGKSYGLEITSEVDERYHIEKATEAACRYFKDAYRKYGNWVNAAASYNAGMGRISSALNNQSVDSAFDLLLVSETSRYVFRILAVKQVFANPYQYGFVLKKEDLYPTVPVQEITVSAGISNIAAYAREHNLNYMQLKEFNPWLRDTKLTVRPGKSYRIAIPKKEDLYYKAEKIKVHDAAWVKTENSK